MIPREDVFFAPYEARQTGAEPADALDGLVVRPGVPADRDALAALVFEREGGDFEEHLRGAAKELGAERADNLVLVAEVEGRLVGFARARYFAHPADPAPNLAPEGWYLAGLIVSPARRRRGVGMELTRRRLEWIAQRAGEAFYFVNARNRASIALHERLGFVELTRDFTFPQAAFTGGVGILYRLELSSHGGQSAIHDPQSTIV